MNEEILDELLTPIDLDEDAPPFRRTVFLCLLKEAHLLWVIEKKSDDSVIRDHLISKLLKGLYLILCDRQAV